MPNRHIIAIIILLVLPLMVQQTHSWWCGPDRPTARTDKHSAIIVDDLDNHSFLLITLLQDPAGIFELIEVVGNGTYGQVYKVSCCYVLADLEIFVARVLLQFDYPVVFVVDGISGTWELVVAGLLSLSVNHLLIALDKVELALPVTQANSVFVQLLCSLVHSHGKVHRPPRR